MFIQLALFDKGVFEILNTMASYTLDDKDFAFSIFQKKGEIDATVRELKKHDKFKAINKTTVYAWANKPDARGKTWKDRLYEIETIKNDLLDRDAARDKAKTISELDQIMDLIMKKIPESEIKTLEGASKAFAILIDSKEKLTGTNVLKDHLNLMGEAIFAALSTHPVVGPLIKQYWDEIKPVIEINFDRMYKGKK